MKTFSATYTDVIKFDKKPNEDAFLVSKKYPIFLVADGVTQSHFPDGTYAYPRGAKEAAQIFCQESLGILEKNFNDNIRPNKVFEQAFNAANQKIKELNVKWEIDKKLNYVEYDWFDAVGITGFIMGDILHYAYVGDCGLVMFDKHNTKKFQTKDMVKPAVDRFKKLHPNYPNFSSNERALIIHRDFRNNPNGKGYGSFSGEGGVKTYYTFGRRKLMPGDLAIFYTDGFLPYLKHPEFIEVVRLADTKKLDAYIMDIAAIDPTVYGNDRTLVSVIM